MHARTRRLTGALVLALAVAAPALAGCTPEGEDASTPAETAFDLDAALTTPATPEWSAELTPIGSSPGLIDGTVVAYVTSDAVPLGLVGLDAETGEQRWSRASSVQDVRNGRLSVRVVDDEQGRPLIASTGTPGQDATGRWIVELSLLDPATGEAVATTSGMWVTSFNSCQTTRVGICFWGYANAEQERSERFRLTPDGSVEHFEDGLGDLPHAVNLGGGVYGVNEDGTDYILRVDDDEEELWRLPAIDAVGRDGIVTNAMQTSWFDSTEERLLITSTGIVTPDGQDRFTAADMRTVVIDTEEGAVLWTRDGEMSCYDSSGRLGIGVLCSGEIGLEKDPESGAVRLYTGAVEIAAVDARSGETVWEASFDDLSGLVNRGQTGAVQSFSDYWALRNGEIVQLIDMATGDIRDLAEGELVACTESGSVQVPHQSIPGNEIVTVATGILIVACGPDGNVPGLEALTEAAVRGSGGWTWRPEGESAPDDDVVRPRLVQTESAISLFQL